MKGFEPVHGALQVEIANGIAGVCNGLQLQWLVVDIALYFAFPTAKLIKELSMNEIPLNDVLDHLLHEGDICDAFDAGWWRR